MCFPSNLGWWSSLKITMEFRGSKRCWYGKQQPGKRQPSKCSPCDPDGSYIYIYHYISLSISLTCSTENKTEPTSPNTAQLWVASDFSALARPGTACHRICDDVLHLQPAAIEGRGAGTSHGQLWRRLAETAGAVEGGIASGGWLDMLWHFMGVDVDIWGER